MAQPSPALAPPPGNPRFELMDSVRGLAALAVVLAHTYNGPDDAFALEHGYWDNLMGTTAVAVPVFFGLSGFLLARPYFAAWSRGRPGPSLSAFWRRRVLRILPAYWVALTLTALFVPAAAQGAFSDRWWLFYGLMQVYSTADIHNGIAVAWSLSVEASFYLLLPLLAMLMRRVGARPVIYVLLVLGLLMRIGNSVDLGASWNVALQHLVYGLPGQSTYFGVGLLLALWSVEGRPSWMRALSARPTTCWVAAAVLYLAISALLSFVHPMGGFDFRTRFIGYHLMTAVFVTLVVVPAAFDEHPGPVRTLLAWPALVWVGVVSYGLYLWHVPLALHLFDRGMTDAVDGWALAPRVALTYAIVLAGALLTAAVSYYVVELPFLHRKERRPPSHEGVNRDSLLREDVVPTH